MTCPGFTCVWADDRERSSGIPEILRTQFRVCLHENRLPWGDYLLSDRTVIERKTVHDFALSVVDGRLFLQVQRMKQHAESALMILEKNAASPLATALHPHAFQGAVLSVILDWNVPVLFSLDAADTARTLWLLTEQLRQRSGEVSLRPGRRPKRLRNRQVYLLQGFPCVGPVTAVRLLECFGSVENVVNASVAQLSQVQGIGQKRARAIKQILTAPIESSSLGL